MKKAFIAVTIILSLIIIGLSSFIVYDKVLKNDTKKSESKVDNNEKESENLVNEYNTNVDVDEDEMSTNINYSPKINPNPSNDEVYYSVNFDVDNYTDISDYLKKQNNITANLKYNYGDLENIKTTNENLTSTQIQSILNEMSVKVADIFDGIGASETEFTINYEKGGHKLYISFYGPTNAIATNDGNLVRIMDKSSDVRKGSAGYALDGSLGNTFDSIVKALREKYN